MKRIILSLFMVSLIGVVACSDGKDFIQVGQSKGNHIEKHDDHGAKDHKEQKTEPKKTVAIDAGGLEPVPAPKGLDLKKVSLGEKLFHDVRLSKDDSISCASCHGLNTGGADLNPRSSGVGGKLGGVNSPTVYNSSLNFVQFWDGRAKDLVEQAAGPVHNPVEMASNWEEVIGKLSKDEAFVTEFKAVYNKDLNGDDFADAIAEFEKSLVTLNSPFDQYLAGNQNAISEEAKKGFEVFKMYGCNSCHNGPNVGGNSFQKFGQFKDYLGLDGEVSEADLGRFNVTKKEEDKMFFKVPSLRTAALTPPYFHDASAKTLDEAIVIMARHQIGVEAEKEHIKQIKAFIESLVGEYKGKNLLTKK